MRASALLPLLLFTGCNLPLDEEEGPGPDTATALADDKADTATDLKAHVTGFTVWAAPRATPVTRAGRRLWIVDGRASKNLTSLSSFVADGPLATPTVKSARTFELALDEGELDTLLAGEPLFLTAGTAGATYGVKIALAPKLGHFTGSGASLSSTVAPVYAAGKVAFRTRATGNVGYDAIALTTDGGAAPKAIADGAARRFRFDLSPAELTGAGTFRFSASGAKGALAKTAQPDFAVTELGLTVGDPAQVWPAPGCDAAVKKCLAGLAPNADTEICGRYAPVLACTPAQAPLCGAALDQALAAATADLLFLSESDRPFQVVDWAGEGKAPLTPAHLLQLLRKAPNTPVVVRPLADELAWVTRDDPEPEEAADVARYKALKALLLTQLPDVQVFRVGTIEVHLYFVGRTACGDLAGVTTIAIET